MFRNRTNTQKPGDELYKDFKLSFPKLRQDASPTLGPAPTLTDALDIATMNTRSFGDNPHHDMSKDGEPTPRGTIDVWNFGGSGLTPSVLDPNSHSFNSFANQMPGYYTPNSGGTSALFHSHHAGDLHTPGYASFGLGTPLSMPTTSEGALHGTQSAMNMQGFQQPPQHLSHDMQQQHLQQQHQPILQQFQSMDPYHLQHHQAFTPPQGFISRVPTFQHMDSGPTDSTASMDDISMDMGMHHSPELMFHPDAFGGNQHAAATKFPHPLSDKFRYHVTLNAPTAMVKHEDEIPITYLNKGQSYTLNVADTAPQHAMAGQLRYRTFVRISFEDPDQRKKPAACWQLWKEGRGTNEAHHRGGRLQAVEYVDPTQGTGSAGDSAKAKIELESASFDGFCVTWTPTANGQIECPIPLRFNFLSTDFSHSKGVKGIPVRLCTKTELLFDTMSPTTVKTVAHEICFCKVKLFRDHGAERKLSNDVAHVKKSIEKVNQQIAQMEAGMRDLGKRKRSSAGQESQRPGKIQKNRRTWSMSSANSPSGRTSAEDELHMKLLVLHEMTSSTRTSSILFLKGTEEDDADLHPVRLTGEPYDLTKTGALDTGNWEGQSVHSSTIVSPTPSNRSLVSRKDSTFQTFGTSSRIPSSEWKKPQVSNMDVQSANPQHLASPPDQLEQPIKVQTTPSASENLSGWIDCLGVDASYCPPPELVERPVACFYVRPQLPSTASNDTYYRAIYLMRRSLQDFIGAVSAKVNIEASQISHAVRVNKAGIHILLGDSDIAQIPEGQDMTAEFVLKDTSAAPVNTSLQWDAVGIEAQADGSTMYDVLSSGYELRLLF